MGVWGWVVLYVLLFALLQFMLYRYLRDEERTPLQSGPGSFDPTGLDDAEAAHLDDDRRQCGHCGVVNDASYTYCRNCVNPIVG